MFDASPTLIWPPILYNSVYLIVTPWLFNTISTPSTHTATSNTSNMSLLTKLTNKNIIILFTLMLSMGISICGVLFTFFKANFFLILIFYSVFGGESFFLSYSQFIIIILFASSMFYGKDTLGFYSIIQLDPIINCYKGYLMINRNKYSLSVFKPTILWSTKLNYLPHV